MLFSHKTCILMATEMEASALIKDCKQAQLNDLPFLVFSYDNFHLLITGMGKSNAKLATNWAVEQGFKKFINAGICGCLNDQLTLFQICYPSIIKNLNSSGTDSNEILGSGVESYRIGTVRKPLHGGQERQLFQKSCDLIDMESYEIALALHNHGISLGLIKCVTDFCHPNGSAEIKKNLPRASLLLRDAIYFSVKE